MTYQPPKFSGQKGKQTFIFVGLMAFLSFSYNLFQNAYIIIISKKALIMADKTC